MEKLIYPNEFWRGISSKDFILEGRVLPDAFQFDDCGRTDGFKELSINWNDDDNALDVLLSQRKSNGKLQFSAGVTQLKLSDVKQNLLAYILRNEFAYERRKIEGNDYHGNLLISEKLPKKLRSLVSNSLALIADTNIIPPKEDFI